MGDARLPARTGKGEVDAAARRVSFEFWILGFESPPIGYIAAVAAHNKTQNSKPRTLNLRGSYFAASSIGVGRRFGSNGNWAKRSSRFFAKKG